MLRLGKRAGWWEPDAGPRLPSERKPDAGGRELAERRRNSGASVVSAFVVCCGVYVYVCASGTSGVDGGCREGRLESREGAVGVAAGGAWEKCEVVAGAAAGIKPGA